MQKRHTPRYKSVKILLAMRRNVFEGASVKSAFMAGNQTTTSPISNANILWGGAATALLGATLAEWQRKRAEEEAARLAYYKRSLNTKYHWRFSRNEDYLYYP